MCPTCAWRSRTRTRWTSAISSSERKRFSRSSSSNSARTAGEGRAQQVEPPLARSGAESLGHRASKRGGIHGRIAVKLRLDLGEVSPDRCRLHQSSRYHVAHVRHVLRV